VTPLTPTIPTITVTPQAASDAYQSADQSALGGTDVTGFSATLQRAVQSAIQTGQSADAQSMKAIAGGGNITDVVTAVSKAELTLEAAMAIRDKMVSAYQDIMRMAI